MKPHLIAIVLTAVVILCLSVPASGEVENLRIKGQRIVYDDTNKLCWYPYLTKTMDMNKDGQLGFIAGLNAAEYASIENWKMAEYWQVQGLKDSLASMGEEITEHAWPWVPPEAPRTEASPFLAWPVQVDKFFEPTWIVWDQDMLVPSMMPMKILGGGPIMFFNGRLDGWTLRSDSPFFPPEMKENDADDHFVTTEFMTKKFATMTWNYDVHYLPDDATTRDGFPGPFGAWIVADVDPDDLKDKDDDDD